MIRPNIRSQALLFGYALCVSQLVAGCDTTEPGTSEGAVGGGTYNPGTGFGANASVIPGAGATSKATAGTGLKTGAGGAGTKVTGGGGAGSGTVAGPGGSGGKASSAKPGTGGSGGKSSSGVSKGGTGGTGGSSSKPGATGGTGGKSSSSSSSLTGGPTVKPVTNGQTAKTTRYWDCCKPSCAWPGKGSTTMKSCGKDGVSSVASNSANICNDNGPAFTCYSYAPWAVSDTLSYGFAATNSDANCGKCYQLDFTSGNLKGKSMIVQATNMGGDVSSNHFDLLIPGGGVGIFNGCSKQWDKDPSALGQQYGGIGADCKTNMTCIQDKCQSLFGDKPALKAGCDWYVNWFKAADNPPVVFAEVSCPTEITEKSRQ